MVVLCDCSALWLFYIGSEKQQLNIWKATEEVLRDWRHLMQIMQGHVDILGFVHQREEVARGSFSLL